MFTMQERRKRRFGEVFCIASAFHSEWLVCPLSFTPELTYLYMFFFSSFPEMIMDVSMPRAMGFTANSTRLVGPPPTEASDSAGAFAIATSQECSLQTAHPGEKGPGREASRAPAYLQDYTDLCLPCAFCLH